MTEITDEQVKELLSAAETDAFKRGEESSNKRHSDFDEKTCREDAESNSERCRRYGSRENDLHYKWRVPETIPDEFSYDECEAAILDAFIFQGGAHVWPGDGSSCATQIVEAVWKKAHSLGRKQALGECVGICDQVTKEYGVVQYKYAGEDIKRRIEEMAK